MRITGRQLRQIIKEEVSRAMLREVDEIAVTDMTKLVDAVTQLEASVADHIGKPLGGAVSAFVACAKGQKNVVYTKLMYNAGQLAQMGSNVGMVARGGEDLRNQLAIGVTEGILAANNVTGHDVNTYGYPANITIDGDSLTGPGVMGIAVSNDEMQLAVNIGNFLVDRIFQR